jgi:hypothetical protein
MIYSLAPAINLMVGSQIAFAKKINSDSLDNE